MSLYPQPLLDLHSELIVDIFCGGGGASSGIEQATGRMVDIAINHDAAAVAIHQANHPQTLHLVSDVFEVDPRQVTKGRSVGLLWASPDCTFHSKARGGKPIRSKTKKRRALAWVVTRWAGQVRPRVIFLENVEEFAQWGPLVGPADSLKPCPRRRGRTFRRWVRSLTQLGYKVEWRELRACDYGAPTIRKRLFLIARCDGEPIVWPEPTHGDPKSVTAKAKNLKPWRTAAECIDWSIPMLSIFATTEEAKAWGKSHGQPSPIRPLAANTDRRIARGVKRYVLDNPRPYLVTIAHGDGGGTRWGDGTRSVDGPLSTVTTKNSHAVVAPYLVPRYGERDGQEPRTRSVEDPSPVIVPDGNGASLVAAHLMTNRNAGKPFNGADEPAHTITAEGAHINVVAANLSTYYGAKDGNERNASLNEPLRVQCTENRHALVASFLATNNGGFADGNSGDGRDVDGPTATITGKGANHSLVTASMVKLRGTSTDADPAEPLDTISSGGTHHGVVAAFLDKANGGFENRVGRPVDEPIATILTEDRGRHGLIASHVQRDFGQSTGSGSDEPIGTITGGGSGKAALVATFLAKYYGTGEGQAIDEPAHTIPTVDRFGLVTVDTDGETYVLSDIKMRMLQPKELYLAQGFRPGYIIDRGADGKPLTKTEQVRMCGNSVSPPVAEAIVRANCADLQARFGKQRRAS